MTTEEEIERYLAFSKPFIDSIKNIFTQMVSTEIKPQKPELKRGDEKARGDISVVMGLNGEVTIDNEMHPFIGMMVLSFSIPTYIRIASAMLSTEYREFSSEIKDVGAEISNITTGNAKKVLKDMGYKIAMSVPSTIVGNSHEIKYPKDTSTVVIPFQSSIGSFVMELCYQDTMLIVEKD